MFYERGGGGILELGDLVRGDFVLMESVQGNIVLETVLSCLHKHPF